jgi:NTE family protein
MDDGWRLSTMNAPPRTALVLSGGGLVGGAWMIGALNAITTETGWDPGAADYVIGTSAGAMIAALLASAVPPWLLMAYAEGEPLEGLPEFGRGRGTFGSEIRLHWSFPMPVLGSPGLALRSLREPWKYGPAGIVAWLPQGMISTEPLKSVIRELSMSGWSPHPNLWIVAIDYETGERVVFGRPGAPRADLADAVAASCAIPGFYFPVTIRKRRYVDGGIYSAANLDLLLASDVELVVCLNPMSSRHRGHIFESTGPIANFVRGSNKSMVDRELGALQRAGKRVILVEPRAEDLKIMGLNYMSTRRLAQIVKTAVRTTSAALRGTELGRQLKDLPSGARDRLRRPSGRPSSWPSDLFPPVRRSSGSWPHPLN